MTSATDSGEVAVREHGTVTAIRAPSLDGTIAVDLDREAPHVGVPEDAHVAFEDRDVDDADDELATDGGIVERVGVTSRGVGLDREKAGYAVAAAAGAFTASGALFSSGELLAGLATFAGAGALTAILSKQRKGVVA